MNSWIDFYNNRATNFKTSEEIGCHYIDNSIISSEFTKLEEARINELLKPTENSTVYDLGCGAGYSSMLLSPNFSKVIGIDAGSQTIKKATEIDDSIIFRKDDITKLTTIANNTIEYALVYGVIYNMGPRVGVHKLLKQLSKRCATGARVLICKIPNIQFYDDYQKYRKEKQSGRNYTKDVKVEHNLEWIWFSPDEMKELLNDSFDVLNILPNSVCEHPFKAWFDTLLVKK